MEPLEGRSLLAGNVLASVDLSGMLNIAGDAKVNNIAISYDATAGAYVISGVNTTINGGAGAVNVNQLALLAGAVFNGGISMNLGGGNDVAVVTGNSAVTAANLAGNLNIDAGIGNDSITIDGITIAGDVTVNGGVDK